MARQVKEHIMRGRQLRRQRHQCFMMGERAMDQQPRGVGLTFFNHPNFVPRNVAQQSEITCKVAIQIV
jgi:hypothetical protein